MSKDTVCAYAWNAIHFSDGVSVCCNSLVRLKNNEGEKTTSKDLLNLKNNNDLIQLRKDLLNGVKNSICDRCWKMEPDSFRKSANDIYPETFNKIITESPDDLPIEHIFLSIGNTCNLNCRMCNPASSSMIEKEWNTNGPHPVNSSNIIASDQDFTNLNHMGDPHFIQFIKDNHQHLKQIYIYGGEPFIIIDEHLKLLQLLVDLGVSENIKINYSTNGTNVNLRRYIDIWKNFKSINISVSCDGMEEVYDYIRWPNTWSKMQKSLDYYYELSKKNDNIDIGIACTIQNTNIYQIEKFHEFIKNRYNKNVFYIPVNSPVEFSLNTLPFSTLKDLSENNLPERVLTYVNEALKTYDAEKTTEKFNNFVKTLAWQDKYRNQNMYDYLPQIREWEVLIRDQDT